MMKLLKLTLYLLFLFTASCWSDSAFFDNQETLLKRLIDDGYENIRFSERSGDLLIYYENRRYRNELHAAAALLAAGFDALPDSGIVILYPEKRALPICGLRIDLSLYKGWMRGEFAQPPPQWLTLQNTVPRLPVFHHGLERRGWGHFDLMVYPSFSIYLGNYDDRFKLFFQLMPVLSTSLWRGAALYVEGAVPIYNDVNYQFYRFKEYAQISKAALSQMIRLPGEVMAAFTVGAFNPNRWGCGGEVMRLFWKRQLALGYRFERTGFLLYYDQLWNYSPIDLTTSQAYAIAYIKSLNLQAGLSYNRYVMKDEGWLFEFSRNFGENSVGAFGGSTNIDKFGGVFIKFPLSRKKLAQPGVIRLALPRYYEYSYRATNLVYTQHAPIQTGIPVYSGTLLTYIYANLTPNYIAHNQDIFLQAYMDSQQAVTTKETPESVKEWLNKIKQKK